MSVHGIKAGIWKMDIRGMGQAHTSLAPWRRVSYGNILLVQAPVDGDGPRFDTLE